MSERVCVFEFRVGILDDVTGNISEIFQNSKDLEDQLCIKKNAFTRIRSGKMKDECLE